MHNGHVEIAEIAASLFDEVVMAAMVNPQKSNPLFTLEERQSMLEESLSHLENVRVLVFAELVVNVVKKEKLDAIVKGLRAVSDFESELQMAQINKQISNVETIFLPCTTGSSFISSRFIREIVIYGGDVSQLVPGPAAKRLAEKFVDK